MMRLLLTAALGPACLAAAADDTLKPRVKLETTLGDIVLELDAEKAPLTVMNFVRYAQEGHYVDTIFHRVMSNFMIQGGGLTADLAEKSPAHDPIKNEWTNGLKNERGTVAMARMTPADSATAQFFINVVDNQMLDQASPRTGGAGYCAFGRVIEGMDVVDRIKDLPVGPRERHTHVPTDTVTIKAATVMTEFSFDAVEQHVKAAAAAAAAAEAKQLETLIAGIESETGKKFSKSDSGLWSLVLTEGAGESPSASDRVKVHYTGWLTDGTKFDSSYDRQQPAEFPLSGVIKGWTEGVSQMKVGEKRKLIIPFDLAYGESGRPPTIPQRAVLHFDIELLEVIKQ